MIRLFLPVQFYLERFPLDGARTSDKVPLKCKKSDKVPTLEFHKSALMS